MRCNLYFCTPLCAFSNRNGIVCPHAKRTLAAQKNPPQKPNRKKKMPIYLKESKKTPNPSTLSSCSSWDCSEQLNSKSSRVVPVYTPLLNKLAQSCCVQCDTYRQRWWRAQRSSMRNIAKHTRSDGAQVAQTTSEEEARSLHPSWYLYVYTHVCACTLALLSPLFLAARDQ